MIYVGKHSTNNLNDGYMGSGIRITRAIKKYGLENFTKEYLAFCDTEEKLNYLERFYIKKYRAKDNGYNLTDGGEGIVGYKFSEESRRKLKESHIGLIAWNKGKTCSEETKKKLSESHKGKHLIFTEDHKQKISEAKKGKTTWVKGKHLSEEHRKNISNSHKGKIMSFRGVPLSEEHKQHLRKPKQKLKWLTTSGEIIEMAKPQATRFHPDWQLLEN